MDRESGPAGHLDVMALVSIDILIWDPLLGAESWLNRGIEEVMILNHGDDVTNYKAISHTSSCSSDRLSQLHPYKQRLRGAVRMDSSTGINVPRLLNHEGIHLSIKLYIPEGTSYVIGSLIRYSATMLDVNIQSITVPHCTHCMTAPS